MDCSRCSGTGICSECDGTRKAPVARDRAGNVLIYGAAWAGGIIAFVAMVAVATNKWVIAILLMAWNGFWYIVFYRNSQRKTSN